MVPGQRILLEVPPTVSSPLRRGWGPHTSGGTIPLHRKARPSTTVGELIPVTVILPPYASGVWGEVVAVEMLGHLPVCDVAEVLGRCRLPLPSLAMSGWGMTFWSTSSLSPRRWVSLCFNARWNWQILRTPTIWSFRLVRVMSSCSWGRHLVTWLSNFWVNSLTLTSLRVHLSFASWLLSKLFF